MKTHVASTVDFLYGYILSKLQTYFLLFTVQRFYVV